VGVSINNLSLLKFFVFIFGCVPVWAGLIGIYSGFSDLEASAFFSDNHYRYLSGLLLGIGLTFWWIIRDIHIHGMLFKALTIIVLIGGCARLTGAFIAGWEHSFSLYFSLIMELVITPLLCLWQNHISKTYGKTDL
jgi:predicted Na+-dependent transporter